jgi:4-hydroxythreonine-4-phosphate dehydrogenase
MQAEDQKQNNKPIIGITLGDINGIGPEVVIKALEDPRILSLFTPVIYGSTKVLSFYRKMFQMDDFQYSQSKPGTPLHPRRINVVNCWQEMIEIKAGQETAEGGKCALLALEQAMADLISGHIDALVTAPINKNNIQSEQFKFIGHTEYITKKFGVEHSLMMMVSEELKVGLVTDHMALKDVPGAITKGLIEKKLNVMIKALKEDFGLEKPRIAVLGLNPHAGEDGLLGDEEKNVIEPVLTEYRRKGHLVFGPYPSDGFFGALQHEKVDGILAMYHDQGLIPFKLLHFENGVNYTAGIPKVRTSPDHGTAYTIAGKNVANPESMREAMYMAANIVRFKNLMKEEISL